MDARTTHKSAGEKVQISAVCGYAPAGNFIGQKPY
jgi:hypothetical protein